MDAAITAIVPLKALARAKGRLSDVLSPAARRELVGWMFGRVAAACQEAGSIGRLVAVVGDAEAGRVAAAHGAEVLVEPAPGLHRALATADAALAAAPATLVVASDLPLVAAVDLEAVCAAGHEAPVVVLAPTKDGGTGALLRRPARVIDTAYGPDSAARHLARARAGAVPALRLERAGLAFDVDEAADLDQLQHRLPEPVTWDPAGGDAR